MPKEGLVLDIGSGGGRDSRGLYRRGLRVIGIDSARKMIEMSQKLEPEIEYRVMDFEELDFPAESFDGIWANASLHHIPKQRVRVVLRKIHTVLKPGGYFQLIVKQGSGEGIRENEKFGRLIRRYFAFYQSEEASQLLQEAGLRVESCRSELNDEWVYALAKKN